MNFSSQRGPTTRTGTKTGIVAAVALSAVLGVVAFGPGQTTIAAVTPTPAPVSASAAAGLTAVPVADTDRVAPAHSIYCRAVAGHEPARVVAGPVEEIAAGRKARRDFEFGAEMVAPAAIAADWQVLDTFTRDVETPEAAVSGDAVGTPMAVAEPTEVTAARSRIERFDADVCGVVVAPTLVRAQLS